MPAAMAFSAMAHSRRFRSILQDFAGGTDIVYYFFVAFIGVNFLVELGVNAVLSAAIARIVKAVQKSHGEANS